MTQCIFPVSNAATLTGIVTVCFRGPTGPLEILAPAGGMLALLAIFLASLGIVDRITHPHAIFLKKTS